MSSRSLPIGAVIALLFVFLIAQLGIGVRSAGQPDGVTVPIPQKSLAILTIRGNEPISVNGASVINAATILSGATIDTPRQVGATVKLGSPGTVDIAPTSTLTLDFDQNSSVRIMLTKGCVILRTRNDVSGEITTPEGIAERTNPRTGIPLDVCFPQSSRTETRAEAVEAAGGNGLFALGRAAIVAITTGRIGAGMSRELADRGRNPGPSAP